MRSAAWRRSRRARRRGCELSCSGTILASFRPLGTPRIGTRRRTMTPQMEDESTIQKNIADKLIAALKTGGFVLYAQKILPLAGGDQRISEAPARFPREDEN